MSSTPEIELEQGFPECPNCFAEIDTWAAEKKAIERERERIIALLEAMSGQGTIQTYVQPNGKDEPIPASVYIDRPSAIALIKGETE